MPKRSQRVELDQYPTPPFMTDILLAECPRIWGQILEPCSGAGWITNRLREWERTSKVTTNDIDVKYGADGAFDATQPQLWMMGPWDWVVSNPPFNVALPIVRHAFESVYYGVAMLLRLSWLEPTKDRAPWLAEHPPTGLIVMERYSFRQNGATDSVTTGWMLWERDGHKTGVVVVPGRTPRERNPQLGI